MFHIVMGMFGVTNIERTPRPYTEIANPNKNKSKRVIIFGEHILSSLHECAHFYYVDHSI